jgi:hypothetical protein
VNLDEGDRQLALDILGTDDLALIEQAISAFCREHIGQGVARDPEDGQRARAALRAPVADSRAFVRRTV